MVRVFGLDIRFGKQIDKEKDMIEKQLIDAKFNSYRTIEDPYKTMGESDVIPYYPLPIRTLYDVSLYSDTLRNIITALRKEIFRNGYEVKEKFAMKCRVCGKEFDHPVDECDDCKKAGRPATDLREPDTQQKKSLLKFLEKCNENGQTIIDVCGSINDDLEIVDDGYMMAIKDYYFDENGELVGDVVVEVIRANPMFIRIIADKTGRPGRNKEGKPVKTCLIHRENLWEDKEYCPICGKKLFRAYFKGQRGDGKFIYYIKDEIYHRSKYQPSLTYGFSPIFSVWMKVVTLMNMDNYIKNYYAKQRPPRGLLFVRTPNMSSLEKAWNWMLDMFKKNPHMIPPIAIEGDTIKGNFVEFIDFMRTLDEMQFTQMREEFRRTIGAVYGVMPLFQADISTSGGLNNEGLQITVTNRAVAEGQRIFNDGFYPWLLKQLKITDYVLELKPSEEKDEMAELQREAQKIQNARMMQSMGFDVTLNEDGDFEYEPTEVPVTPPMPEGLGFSSPKPSTVEEQKPQRFTGESKS